MVRLLKYENLLLFKKDVTDFLEQDEVVNNLLLGVLQSNDKSPLLMAVVLKDEEIALVMLQTQPAKIILSKAASFSPGELQLIAEQMYQYFQSIPGLIGDRKLIVELSGYLSKLRGDSNRGNESGIIQTRKSEMENCIKRKASATKRTGTCFGKRVGVSILQRCEPADYHG